MQAKPIMTAPIHPVYQQKTGYQTRLAKKSNFTVPVENKNFIPVQYVLVEQPINIQSQDQKSSVTVNLPSVRVNGNLKFFDHNKGFGFLTLDDGSDVFLHHDDLLKASMDLRSCMKNLNGGK